MKAKIKMRVVTSRQIAGKCPNGHRICMSPRCWLKTMEGK